MLNTKITELTVKQVLKLGAALYILKSIRAGFVKAYEPQITKWHDRKIVELRSK